mmetsp:Transcript_24969/g.58589  ORF Transcript_24969/g.58589 Transcript_24969/m.58589 type:complete len:292 (+) Transcript_24969:1066-1941(+)
MYPNTPRTLMMFGWERADKILASAAISATAAFFLYSLSMSCRTNLTAYPSKFSFMSALFWRVIMIPFRSFSWSAGLRHRKSPLDLVGCTSFWRTGGVTRSASWSLMSLYRLERKASRLPLVISKSDASAAVKEAHSIEEPVLVVLLLCDSLLLPECSESFGHSKLAVGFRSRASISYTLPNSPIPSILPRESSFLVNRGTLPSGFSSKNLESDICNLSSSISLADLHFVRSGRILLSEVLSMLLLLLLLGMLMSLKVPLLMLELRASITVTSKSSREHSSSFPSTVVSMRM